MKIPAQWVDWTRKQIDSLRDGGFFIFPEDGVIIKANKKNKNLILVFCKPEWISSDKEDVARKVFAALDYKYIVEDYSTSPDEMISKIAIGNYTSYEMFSIIDGLSVIFQIQFESLVERIPEGMRQDVISAKSAVRQKSMKNAKKSDESSKPLNPITLYQKDGHIPSSPEHHVSLGRLWIEVSHHYENDGAHKVNMNVVKGPKHEKPVAIIFWKGDQSKIEVNHSMQLDEEEFVKAFLLLKNGAKKIKLWGNSAPRALPDLHPVYIIMTQEESNVRLELYSTDQDKQKYIAGATFPYSYVFNGLNFLFVEGEFKA